MAKIMNKLIEDTKVPTIVLIGIWTIGMMTLPFMLPLINSKWHRRISTKSTPRGMGNGAPFIRAIHRAKRQNS